MAHIEFQKNNKVTLGVLNQDINANAYVGTPWSMTSAHHAAILFDVGVLASDVICCIYEGIESHAIVAVTSGGAEAGNFGIAGNYASLFTVGLFLVVSGSTGNDEIYTVDAAGAAYAGGVTTIEVDEAVASAVADGNLTLVKAMAAKTVTYTTATDETIGILEVEASELDIANGYQQIVVHISAVGANAGYVGASVVRVPLRNYPPAVIT